MRLVLDTNVFVSAVFFGGVPGQILELWNRGDIELLLTEEILSEYLDVLRRLTARYPGVDPDAVIGLVVKKAVFVQAEPLPGPVCTDPTDDKFLAAALGGKANVVVSGDRHLLGVSGYRGVAVVKPADFVARYGQ